MIFDYQTLVSKGFLDFVRAGPTRVNLSLNFASFLFSDHLWELSSLAGNFFWATEMNFFNNPAVSQPLTGKPKNAPGCGTSFCIPVEAWEIAVLVEKVYFRGPKKISLQRGQFSKMIRKQKWCKIHRKINPRWSRRGMVPLALTKSKKPFETFRN